MPSTIRGVNAFETSARTRVWSGGSMSRMPLRIRCQNGPCQSGSSGRPISACVATWWYVRPNRRSRSSALTSANRETSQWSVGSWYQIGVSARISAYTGIRIGDEAQVVGREGELHAQQPTVSAARTG